MSLKIILITLSLLNIGHMCFAQEHTEPASEKVERKQAELVDLLEFQREHNEGESKKYLDDDEIPLYNMFWNQLTTKNSLEIAKLTPKELEIIAQRDNFLQKVIHASFNKSVYKKHLFPTLNAFYIDRHLKDSIQLLNRAFLNANKYLYGNFAQNTPFEALPDNFKEQINYKRRMTHDFQLMTGDYSSYYYRELIYFLKNRVLSGEHFFRIDHKGQAIFENLENVYKYNSKDMMVDLFTNYYLNDEKPVNLSTTISAIQKMQKKDEKRSQEIAAVEFVKYNKILGDLFYLSPKTNENTSSELNYYQKASDAGNAEASYQLGMIFRDADSLSIIQRDYSKSLIYLRKASDSGYLKSWSAIAECFENGWGVNKDLEIAQKYYELALQNGDITNGLSGLKRTSDRDMEQSPAFIVQLSNKDAKRILEKDHSKVKVLHLTNAFASVDPAMYKNSYAIIKYGVSQSLRHNFYLGCLSIENRNLTSDIFDSLGYRGLVFNLLHRFEERYIRFYNNYYFLKHARKQNFFQKEEMPPANEVFKYDVPINPEFDERWETNILPITLVYVKGISQPYLFDKTDSPEKIISFIQQKLSE